MSVQNIRERFFPHIWCPGCGHGTILNNLLHAVRRELGTELPFDVISGYRSPHTNETLRTTRGGGGGFFESQLHKIGHGQNPFLSLQCQT